VAVAVANTLQALEKSSAMTTNNPDAAAANREATAALPGAPSVTLVTATALAVADMVGIGVFTSLGFQVKDLPSGFSLIMLWFVGGVMALCGALCYAELAAAYPRSGGEYNFLSRIYHQAIGFLAGWVSATVGFAAPVALAAMAFGQYLTGVVPGAPPLLMALAVVWLVTAVQLAGIKQAAAFQNISTLLKAALILLFIVAGFAFGERQPVSFTPSAADWGYLTSAPFFISLFYVMYSYAGWNAATYIAGEIKDPRRNLPLSMLIAVAAVTLLYVLLNVVFFYTTPVAKLAGQVDVGLVAGKQIFGDAGGRMVGALICIGLISAVSAMMWIGPRVTMAMGEDLPLLSVFARKTRSGVPALAILTQAAIATFLLLTQTFKSVVEFVQFSLTFCSALAVLGVLVLRTTRPELPRPYRVWAYPLPPLLFLAMSLFMMIYLLREQPREALIGVAIMLTGLLIYFVALVLSPSPKEKTS
jgi:APA family basic amino acid/polyamine antiporter